MFLYVYNVDSLAQAEAAIKKGATAIGIFLSYKEDAVRAETKREVFLALPPLIWRVGIFKHEDYYNVEEFATFCFLDILHFAGGETAEDIKHYSTRCLWEAPENFAEGELPGDILFLTAAQQANLKVKTNKPWLLAWEEGQDVAKILKEAKPWGLAVPFARLGELPEGLLAE